jgi:hypothetical protein
MPIPPPRDARRTSATRLRSVWRSSIVGSSKRAPPHGPHRPNLYHLFATSAESEVWGGLPSSPPNCPIYFVGASGAGHTAKILNNFLNATALSAIIEGDYLRGGLTNALMKDVTLYVELMQDLSVPSLNSSGPLASFGLAIALGYTDDISNTVVDAIGDISGGVRLHDGSGKDDS